MANAHRFVQVPIVWRRSANGDAYQYTAAAYADIYARTHSYQYSYPPVSDADQHSGAADTDQYASAFSYSSHW